MSDRPQRSGTYHEFDNVRPGHPEYQAWIDWLRTCGFPPQQVDPKGWVARDVRRKTVSAKIVLWHPGEQPDMVDRAASCIAHRDVNGYEVEQGVMTIQLDEEPPPFPEPFESREVAEERARASLSRLWAELAEVGDLDPEDRPNVAEWQRAISQVGRLLRQIKTQRAERRGLQVGLTYGHNLIYEGP